MSNRIYLFIVLIIFLPVAGLGCSQKTFTNSFGMQFIRVESGTFTIGCPKNGVPEHLRWFAQWGTPKSYYLLPANAHFDEYPVHKVEITTPFYIGIYEVTNAQYELFDPNHGEINHYGFAHGPNEAVIMVSYFDANEFCNWLNKNDSTRPEGLIYRLPTEAEWEYACRAGTTGHFSITTPDGNLPAEYLKNPNIHQGPYPISLDVGKTTANPWGIYDMHGNVEEWCYDWYGPYVSDLQVDPVGRADGIFKVTRGGSHETTAYYLRSSNRLSTVPQERNWLVGFRVVLGKPSTAKPLLVADPPLCMKNVSQTIYDWSVGPDMNKPYFSEPITYVKVPFGSDGPMYSYENHSPALTWCPNGDLLVAWFSCTRELGREVIILGSRLRAGSNSWDQPSIFWEPADRNDHQVTLLNDGNNTIYHFNGISHGPGHGKVGALLVRTSTDNGATWSKPRFINPDRCNLGNAPIPSVFRTKDGTIILPVDEVGETPGDKDITSAMWISRDNGLSWQYPGGDSKHMKIRGRHPAIVDLADGSLMALTRQNNTDGKMTMNISKDFGQSWTYSASEFPGIATGQRLVLKRLLEGPILLVSFTGEMAFYWPDPNGKDGRRFSYDRTSMPIPDKNGIVRDVNGMFAALSFDEGKTWPVKRLITPSDPCQIWFGYGHTRWFKTDAKNAEPGGYLTATQTPDGVIHLISSGLHYRFNLAWLMEPKKYKKY